MSIIVTTIYKPSSEVEAQGLSLALKLNAAFIPRLKQSLKTLQQQHDASVILVTTTMGPIVYTERGKYFFHLSMSELRIKNILDGQKDHMIEAMSLGEGMSVLDCTLGLATDAIVASYILGEQGSIIGLESSPVISLVAQDGLKNFTCDDQNINQSMRRIQVINANYINYLESLPAKSFDIVYFDPMFRHPVFSSCSLNSIRNLANEDQLSMEALNLARRAAKRRVVVKEAHASKEFTRLGITTLVGGKYSSIKYGIIEVG